MKFTVFAKQRTTSDGVKFTAYLGRLTKKDGSEVTASIMFSEDAGRPKKEECPMVIEVDKKQANLSTSKYVREDTGEEGTSYTLWVNAWKPADEPFVDHSLDDFE